MLTSAEGTKTNRERFTRYLQELEAHQKRISRIADRSRAQYVAAIGSPEQARSFLKGFDESLAKRSALAAEMLANQRAVVGQMSALTDFMAARMGSVTMRREQLIFSTDADVQAYGAFMARIDELAK